MKYTITFEADSPEELREAIRAFGSPTPPEAFEPPGTPVRLMLTRTLPRTWTLSKRATGAVLGTFPLKSPALQVVRERGYDLSEPDAPLGEPGEQAG